MEQDSNQQKKQSKQLAEGVDFTVENGLVVFTAHYLKNRGYCCQNGCRNCPYGFKKTVAGKPTLRP